MAKNYTGNTGKMNGPIPYMSMGPLANRPSVEDMLAGGESVLNSCYISTGETAGKLKVYFWNGTEWTLFKGLVMK